VQTSLLGGSLLVVSGRCHPWAGSPRVGQCAAAWSANW